ncbi:two-component regulator propeller domain-containing protein [Mangrovibacterium sp.]|uniref:two-component regulator propeller domain-containing protein n=1 Tax=Mangrovibacterium sp. TaxID=1961364 RepID=UPI003563F7C1
MKNTITRLAFWAVFVLLWQISFSETLKFEHFSNKDGFNQNTINAIVDDKYGFLWFGTPNGLIQYDGYDFINFNHDPLNENSISNNYVQSLFTDSDGNLWIGTWAGINVYIPRIERIIRVPAYPNLVVNQITADSDGLVWISGTNALFTCRLNNVDNTISFDVSDNLFKAEPSILPNSEICFIDRNRILSFNERGLFTVKFETDASTGNVSLTSVHNYSELANLEIKAIHKADNLFWIGTNSGLYKIIIDGERLRIMEKFELTTWDNRVISDLDVLSIFEDQEGNVWIGSIDEGIFKYNYQTDSFENYGYNPKDETGISNPRINCFFQDRFGVLWIGTAQGGINKLDVRQKQFISYFNNPYHAASISGNLINSILEDSKGYLWVANYKEPICRSIAPVDVNNIGQLNFECAEGQCNKERNNVVSVIYEDRKGFIWFGGNKSVYVFNPGTKQCKKVEFEEDGVNFSLTSCRVINQINSNTVLLGGNSVLLVKNPWDQFQKSNNPIFNISDVFGELGLIQAFVKDRFNRLWFGSNNGLFLCDINDDKITANKGYSSDEGSDIKLSHNNIFSLYEDRKGQIWVGTFGGGLNKITLDNEGLPLHVEHFRKNGILPDDAVYGILQEDDQHLWLSTDMGLCRMNIVENKIDLFDVRDGLINNNFRQGAYHKGKSGYFYFGGLNGLTIFKPENIKLNDVLPNSLISGVDINHSSIKIGDEVNGKIILNKSVFETNEITIKHQAKIVSFHIATQHNAAPRKNKIAYMLEGFNNDWMESRDGKTTITYTNLPAGEYILRIKSANGDGLWNTESRDLKITVLPPWYQTIWAIMAFIFVFIALIIGVVVYFINHEKLKQRLNYEQIDKRRIDSINQAKLRFFTDISHEFRTPLTLISGPLEHLIQRNTDKENVRDLTLIQNNAKRLLRLVDQLVTFRKAEQGYLTLNQTNVTLSDFIYPTTEAFEDYAIQKNINFFYKINSPNEEVVIDVEKTERIIFNLLSNSFRHTPAHGNISIETDVVLPAGQKMISIKVIDTGRGIPKDKQERIFDRFYQLERRNENVGGTGIGLAFCKSLIDLMGGTITVESEPDNRTCFTILIPSKAIEDKNAKMTLGAQSFIKDWIPTQSNGAELTIAASNDETKESTVVIVDDEVDVRDFLLNLFSEKYSVILAENGVDGLNKIRQYNPDLIVSDVMMPEMNGFVLCETIKSDPELCHMPVVLLTALDDTENQIKGLEFRADDYIGKPFSPRHLAIRVEQLIENKKRLKEYFSKNSDIPDKTIQISTRDKDFLNQVVSAIENNLSDSSFGVEELANEIGLSPSQFYRRLKQLTGQIPNVYLRNYRLQRAAELLKSNEGLNVAEVMYQIGIESNSYFSTSFKKLHGASPSEFIKRHIS